MQVRGEKHIMASTLPALYPIMQCTTFHFYMMDEAKAPNIFGHLHNIKNTDE